MSPYTGDVVGLSFDYNTMICQVGYYLYSVRVIMLFFYKLEFKCFRGRNFISAYLKYISNIVKYNLSFISYLELCCNKIPQYL